MWFLFTFAKTTAINLHQPARLINNYFYYVPPLAMMLKGEKTPFEEMTWLQEFPTSKRDF